MPVDHQTLCSFVPARVVVRAGRAASPPGEPWRERFPAGLLFADISGFTALTESLAARGRSGAEELTQILNGYFGSCIELIAAHGGEVAKFAGDALVALWPCEPGEAALRETALRVARCALVMQARLNDFEVARGLRLRMKLGVGAGDITQAQLGGVFDRFEYLIAGPPLEEVGRAHDHARPGDVMLAATPSALIAGNASGEACPDGTLRLASLAGDPPPSAAPIASVDPAAAPVLRAFVPGAIRARLDAGQGEWLGELRTISVVFTNLPGFKAELPLERAQQAMCTLQEQLYRFEGSINKISVDDKGASVLAALGLPPLAHEDDAIRAVSAALAIDAALRALGFATSTGIATGLAYCGAVGNARRREYTLMGDVVNLAARLMVAAKGGILADEATARVAAGRIDFETLAPIKLKGKAAPVAIFRPTGRRGRPLQARAASGTLVSRAAECALFLERFDAGASPLLIIAEPGLGKSRLLAELAALAEARGAEVLMVTGDPFEQAIAYAAFREVFQQVVLDGFAALQRREQVLALLPAVHHALAPVLEPLVPAEWEETEQTRRLPPRARAAATRTLAAALLAAVGERHPTVLMVDDAQALDSASRALLLDIARGNGPFVVVASHPFNVEPTDHAALRALPNARCIDLPPLDQSALGRISAAAVGADRLSPALERLIATRAEGNARFAEEMVRSMRDSRLIETVDGTAHAGDTDKAPLPTSIEAIVTSRIDRLSAAEQMTLKVASVVGRVFDLPTLGHIHPMRDKLEDVALQCRKLDALDLTPAQSDGAFRFKSDLTKQVAYNLMLFSQRRSLHRMLAAYLEARSTDAPGAPALIAQHWTKAAGEEDLEATAKAVEWCGTAAAEAARLFANPEAIGFFREALRLIELLPSSPKRDRRELELRLAFGPLLTATSSWGDPQVRAEYERARALALSVGDADSLFGALRGVWQTQVGAGDYSTASRLAAEMVSLAETAGNDALLVEATRALGTTLFFNGEAAAARGPMERCAGLFNPERHAALAARWGQDPDVANRAILAWALCYVGEPSAARQHVVAAEARAGRLAHPFTQAFARGARMWLHFLLDEPEDAREAARDVRRICDERGFAYLAIAGRLVEAWADARLDDAAAALAEVEAAIASWRATGATIGLPMFHVVLAEVASVAGNWKRALSALAPSENAAAMSIEPWVNLLAHRLRGEALAALGDLAAAVRELAQGIDAAHAKGAKLVELRLLLALCRLRPENSARLRAVAREIPADPALRPLAEANTFLDRAA